MGSSASKPITDSTVTSYKRTDEKSTYLVPMSLKPSSGGGVADKDSDKDLVERMAKYLTLDTSISGAENPFETANLISWEKQLLSDPKNQLALSAATNVDFLSLVRNRSAAIDDAVHIFSDKVELEGSPITNQRSSGRCWLFASTNVLRVPVIKKYNLPGLELSQAYLFFYDKLEKSNFFLQNVIDTASEPLDSRLIETLFKDPNSDGGQWDMVVNLVNKYGLIPQALYPDSFNAKNSSAIDGFVVNKLREYALILRKLANDESISAASIGGVKEKFVHEIFDILTIAFGVPPKPTETFTWEYTDKDSKYHVLKSTPLDFAKTSVGVKVDDYFSLIHDPRNDYKALYTVDKLGNIVGGKSIEYVNAEIDVLKQAAIKAIKNNEPVFFGSDVGKFMDRETGVLDTQLWNYELAFNTKLGLTKKERLTTGSSAMTHAMVFTAVHIVDGKPTKWKVENSWGDDSGDKGYYTMSDDWFNEYVLQVVTSAKYVDKEYVNIWKSKKFVTLPAWDPLGALA